MMRYLLLLASITFFTQAIYASEHPACQRHDFPVTHSTSQELRAIGKTCESKKVRELFAHRANFRDLVAEGKLLSGIIVMSSHNQNYHLESYQLYMAMVESLSRVWFPQSEQRIAFLCRQYETHNEVAKLRIRGYDLLADQLEKQASLWQADPVNRTKPK